MSPYLVGTSVIKTPVASAGRWPLVTLLSSTVSACSTVSPSQRATCAVVKLMSQTRGTVFVSISLMPTIPMPQEPLPLTIISLDRLGEPDTQTSINCLPLGPIFMTTNSRLVPYHYHCGNRSHGAWHPLSAPGPSAILRDFTMSASNSTKTLVILSSWPLGFKMCNAVNVSLSFL